MLAKVESKSVYSVSGKGLHYAIHKVTFSTKNSKCYKNKSDANCSCRFEIKGDVHKRAIKRTQPVLGEFLSNLFLVGKKTEVIALWLSI